MKYPTILFALLLVLALLLGACGAQEEPQSPEDAEPEPFTLSVSLPGYPSQNIVTDLSDRGICISAGSACHRGKASHVLTAMGLDKRTAAGTVRVSFGPETSFEDVDALFEALLAHRNTRFPML